MKQKSEIEKAKNDSSLKDKMKKLEADHVKERKDTQKEFDVYK